MDVYLEEVRPEDVGELLTLQHAAAIQKSVKHSVPVPPEPTQTPDELRAELENCVAVKAMIGRRMVGSVRMRVEGETGYLNKLLVAPVFQGRGIGTMLMREIEIRAPLSVRRFVVSISHKSVRTISLYKWLGYTEFKREETPDGAWIISMEKQRRFS